VITPASLKNNFTNEGGVGGTFRFSKNIAGLWLVQECRRQWAHEGEEISYEELTRMAAQAKSFCAVIDVDDADFLKPGDMLRASARTASARFKNRPNRKANLWRCALEGMRSNIVLCWNDSKKWWDIGSNRFTLSRRKPRIVCSASSTADATNRHVVTGPVEATAIGNMMVQAIALGHIDTIDDARAIIANSFVLDEFEPKDSNRLGMMLTCVCAKS